MGTLVIILAIICALITGCGFSLMIMAYILRNSNQMGDSTGSRFTYQKEPVKVIQLEEC